MTDLILPRRRASPLDVADVFSTDLWTGNSSTQSITNGVDLSGEGGLVWIKNRTGGSLDHMLFDTLRGVGKEVISNSTAAQSTDADALTAFNSNGFSLGGHYRVNAVGGAYVGWTYRKSEKFFDVVTYTGDGVAGREISHSLGTNVGLVVVKRTNAAQDWRIYHRGAANKYIEFNTAAAGTDNGVIWGNGSTHIAPTSSVFTVSANSGVNANTDSYVAYIFAHDTTDNGIIQCGSYTGNGSTTGPTITLGWEPQWVLVKRSDAAANWLIYDQSRGFSSGSDNYLIPDSSGAESALDFATPTSTGFDVTTTHTALNASGGTYVYMAIRKEGA